MKPGDIVTWTTRPLGENGIVYPQKKMLGIVISKIQKKSFRGKQIIRVMFPNGHAANVLADQLEIFSKDKRR